MPLHIAYSTSITGSVQEPNICGFWFHKPYSEWYWVRTSLNIGYLDPLGNRSDSLQLLKSGWLGGFGSFSKVQLLLCVLGSS